MARIEKTVFISYRRTDISWALAVYQYLASQKYDVFFDYTHIPSGDFEQIIVSNIKARAHFVLILTPNALDRTSNQGDWLRREIETAIDEKRNIIPLFFDGFSFGSPDVKEKLTGKMGNISRYNGLEVPSGYFPEAMERLSNRYLNVSLDAVIHPLSTEVRKKVREEKVAANKALREQKSEVKELVKPTPKITEKSKQAPASVSSEPKVISTLRKEIPWKPLAGIVGALAVITLCIWGGTSLWGNLSSSTPDPTRTSQPVETEEPQPATTNTPVPTEATLGIGSTMTGKDGMTLLYVPAGEFTMGSNADDALAECEKYRSDCQRDWFTDEEPPHKVDLDAFWIDETEVTNAMYAMCVSDGDCGPPSSTKSYSRDSYYGNSQFDDYPVIYVSWNDAQAYCSWADRRLPTEAEWEKASRGTNSGVYPWGDTFDGNLVNFCDTNCSLDWKNDSFDDGFADTSPVGSYPNGASLYGALDMAGNVWEWVADWYDNDYYANSPESNPTGPESGDRRVLRGGSWLNSSYGVRSAYRSGDDPSSTSYDFGFRCASSQ